jgi:hypothetical protein
MQQRMHFQENKNNIESKARRAYAM